MKTIELSEGEILLVKDLLELCIEDDLLDLDAYDSISRAHQISCSWKALDVLKRITAL